MLIAENINKRFAGIAALENVSLELHPGKVTAIIGENGAGKSTLMKILSGVYPDYEGRILFNDKEVRFANPKEAQECGITIIHQELNLIPGLSITENVFLGREVSNSWNILDQQAMRQKTQQLLDKLKLNVSPDTTISDLKVGQQQVVEIAKALLTDSEVIIMDEPTSAISDHEVEILFGIIEGLRKENKAIVYISHKLDELFRIADNFVVLRDGKVTECGEMKGISHDAIIKKMVGRDIQLREHTYRETERQVLLEVKGLSLKSTDGSNKFILDDVSFQLYKKEVLGIFGLMGAGRTELLETIMGVYPGLSNGKLYLEEKPFKAKLPQEAIRSGLVLVPEDRKQNGLILGHDVKNNISLSSLKEVSKSGILNTGRELQLADKYISALKIKTSSANQQVKNLSGGNQQKVVLAKCLATKPKVLMLDEPTRGIDVNAKNEIYKLIAELSATGLGIIVVSSELPEILAVSDRVLVMSEGKITAEFTSKEASENNILKAAIPKTI
ncbi:MAG: sugar ABC transporter ATP-binding protein [Sphingobacteriaceae bacterium]|nr:sugar ABC transporter ATP-binding protein [Sphingobacteriaceae bacterium]